MRSLALNHHPSRTSLLLPVRGTALLTGLLLVVTSLFAAASTLPLWHAATSRSAAAANLPESRLCDQAGILAASSIETMAYDYLKTAAEGYGGIDVTQVAALCTVGSVGGPQVAASLIVQYGGFPNVDQLADGSFGPLTVGLVPGNPGISASKIASVTANIAAMLDNADTLCWADWSSTDIGAFNSVIALNLNEVKLDTFVSNMLPVWPAVPGQFHSAFVPPSEGGKNKALLPFIDNHSWVRFDNPIFGNVALVETKVKVQCSDGEVVTCTTEDAISTGFLYEGKVSHECKTIDNPDGTDTECCYCEVSLGIVSGFKSLSVGVGSFKLTVSGTLGCSIVHNTAIQECCGEGEEE